MLSGGEKMKLIDMHCHAFPDKIADHALHILTQNCDYIPQTDGTMASTLRIQKKWGCKQFVLLNIATSPRAVRIANDFLIEHNDNRHIFSFGSICPGFSDYKAELDRLERAGIKGIKFHSGYQNFPMDSKEMYPLYEEIAKRNMILLFHGGYDPGFPELDYYDPYRARHLADDFKGAKIILAHMGNCMSNRETMKHLLGTDVYFDVSMAAVEMPKQEMEQLIKAHGVEKFLYGTDCPWSSGIETQNRIRSLNLLNEDKEKIFYKNAAKLLNINEGEVEE